jgi:transcriptional regulator with XRE-family HTH domain
MSRRKQTAPNLRAVAERVGLAPCSVSSVLNNAPAAQAIPQSTKERIFRAAAELNYRPNLWARSLRTKRTRMVAAITPDFGSPAVARVIAAAQERLQRKGYLLILARLDSADAPFTHSQFHQRGIEGVIVVGAALPQELDLPIATVDLTGLAPSDFTEESVQSWLSELGISAAESVMRNVEAGASQSPVAIEPKIRPSFEQRTELNRSSSRRSVPILRELCDQRLLPPRNAAENAEA